ncbi:glyoxalase [Altererythrobacter salegens]|uniref:Glyoxalase n=1 Tax=Croceibacterium salegens TaxID=1737568 RepID=A0A6I4SUM6_9SPHN|nr:glyoxalase [Croceibacterium salegens]MXO58516.1 glyoxalase [Croceibacterium salegens]
MANPPPVGAFAIVPTMDLPASIAFWEQMGFARTGGEPTYVILTGWDCEVHLRPGDPPPWDVPEHNPFGVFIRTPHVDEIAERMADRVIRPGGVLRHREWGLYEVGLAGPDNLLVRVGWPSDLVRIA